MVWGEIEGPGDRKLNPLKMGRVVWAHQVDLVNVRPNVFESYSELRKQPASRTGHSERIHGTVTNVSPTDERDNSGIEHIQDPMGHLHVFSLDRL